MKKIRVFIIILVLPFLVVGSAWAAKIILKEGKILHGRIVSEDEEEVMLILGTNMTLRIQKSKIKEIIRKKKPEKKKNIVTLDDVTPDEDKKTEKPTKKKAKKKTKPTVPDQVVVEASQQSRTSDWKNMSLRETVIFKTYEVRGKTFKEIHQSIFAREKGKGIKNKTGRMASQTTLNAKWKAKAMQEKDQMRWTKLVITATMTCTLPHWKAKKKTDPEEIKKWNVFLNDLIKHDEGHRDIYLRALINAGESLEALRKPDKTILKSDSKRLFKQALKQAEKRQTGFDRHFQRRSKQKKTTPKNTAKK